jgi:SNF2 family DNA or RNA helicase
MARYEPRLADKPHQTIGKDRMRGRRVFALLMAMRTGKTKTALDDFGEMELAGEAKDLHVMAPKGSYRVWLQQIREHASEDLLTRARVHVWETKGGVDHDFALREFMRSADPKVPRILIQNIESLVTERARDLTVNFVGQRHAEVVVDESTIIKTHNIARTKFMLRRVKPLSSYRRILSGLPAPRDPLDLFCQFYFLDSRILRCTNYYEFKARYAITRRIPVPNTRLGYVDIVVGFQYVDEIAELIAPHSYRIKLDDIVELPVKYEQWEVEMTPEQRRIYVKLREEAIAELEVPGTFVSGAMVVVRMLRLHQLLMGYVVDQNGVHREIDENRTQALLDLLAEYDGKAVIWCSYDYSVRKIAAALEKEYGAEAVARFWGRNANVREEEDRRFTQEDKCRFMVATPGSGGRGRKWDVANLVVYYSNTDNLEHRDQSEERAKDMHKEATTLYVDLVVKGTVDEKIIRALRQKINLAATITGDDYREWLI